MKQNIPNSPDYLKNHLHVPKPTPSAHTLPSPTTAITHSRAESTRVTAAYCPRRDRACALAHHHRRACHPPTGESCRVESSPHREIWRRRGSPGEIEIKRRLASFLLCCEGRYIGDDVRVCVDASDEFDKKFWFFFFWGRGKVDDPVI